MLRAAGRLARLPVVGVASIAAAIALANTPTPACATAETPASHGSATTKTAPAAPTAAWKPARKFRVGVLGATGAVGQRFIEYLDGHPWFEVVRLGASGRSEGKPYEKATTWNVTADVPACVRGQTVVSCHPKDYAGVDFVFSALDASVAGDVEAAFRDAGIPVFSNAKNYRMVPDVPLVVPPVNGDHLRMVAKQASYASNGGFIVTNANCSTTGMVIALKPIHDAFGIEAAHVTTLQAISGAGYPGLPSLDILDNVVPYISGEEDKLETEYRKIMGTYIGACPHRGSGKGAPAATPGAATAAAASAAAAAAAAAASSSSTGASGLKPAVIVEGKSPFIEEVTFPLSAMVNRVHVKDGHSIAISLKLKKPATPEEVAKALRDFRVPAALAALPSAPSSFITVREEANRPQPRLDRDTGRGFTTVVGRIRPDPVYTVKLFVLSHNTVMGAAGSSILNAEYAAVKGLLKPRGD